MKRTVSYSLLAFVSLSGAYAQSANGSKAAGYAATITAADLSTHLHIIAADSMQGRNTGEAGQKMAAEYIAGEFFNYGLQAVVTSEGEGSRSFYQPFELAKRSWGEVYVETGTQRRKFMEDFYILGSKSIPEEIPMEVVLGGYGIEASGYSDYKDVDVRNKAVLIWEGEPRDKKGKSLVSSNGSASEWTDDWRKKVDLAKQKGAALVFVVVKDKAKLDQTINQYRSFFTQPMLGFKDAAATAATFFIAPEMAAELFGIKEKRLEKLQQRTSRQKKSVAGTLKNATISVKAERKEEMVGTENVLGLVEGRDKKDEIVVITAHYDHVGVMDGEVYNGADDDGSGTVAVLEMAQAFAEAKTEGNGPRRSILFMTVTGEEKGLLGSEYYTKNPVFPLRKTVADLNIDMIGRVDIMHEDNPDYIYLIGSDKLSSELHQISEQANQAYTKLQLDYKYNDPNDPNRFYYRSDHYNFAKNNIPVIFYFNGVHEDYHQPGDDVEKINFQKMEKITRLVFHTAWEVANREQRIAVDSNKQ